VTLLAASLLIVTVGSRVSRATTSPAERLTSNDSATQTIRDAAGRTVTLPMHITRIADIGATPVVNSLLFLFGARHKIVNNLPAALQKPDFHFQYASTRIWRKTRRSRATSDR
jgi:ABC-type Fe3+-hydroxamate transport system substrate-binding protein